MSAVVFDCFLSVIKDVKHLSNLPVRGQNGLAVTLPASSRAPVSRLRAAGEDPITFLPFNTCCYYLFGEGFCFLSFLSGEGKGELVSIGECIFALTFCTL